MRNQIDSREVTRLAPASGCPPAVDPLAVNARWPPRTSRITDSVVLLRARRTRTIRSRRTRRSDSLRRRPPHSAAWGDHYGRDPCRGARPEDARPSSSISPKPTAISRWWTTAHRSLHVPCDRRSRVRARVRPRSNHSAGRDASEPGHCPARIALAKREANKRGARRALPIEGPGRPAGK